MSDLLVFAFLFFIGSCLGWGIEVIFRKFFSHSNPQHKWINPGFLTGPYLPLYGFGLWGMYFVSYLSKIAMTGIRAVDTVLILMIMAVVMTVIEYIAGVIFIRGMKVKLWDYSHERGNIQGIICPKFTLAWGVLGCFYYFFILYRYVFRCFPDRCMLFDEPGSQHKEIRRRKTDSGEIRGTEGFHEAAA